MAPFLHTGLSISDSLKSVRKSVLIYETIIVEYSIEYEDEKKKKKCSGRNPVGLFPLLLFFM